MRRAWPTLPHLKYEPHNAPADEASSRPSPDPHVFAPVRRQRQGRGRLTPHRIRPEHISTAVQNVHDMAAPGASAWRRQGHCDRQPRATSPRGFKASGEGESISWWGLTCSAPPAASPSSSPQLFGAPLYMCCCFQPPLPELKAAAAPKPS
jgi:hypothetical protein